MQNMGQLMEKCMTPADLDGVSIDDLGLNCSSSTAPSFNPDKATVSNTAQSGNYYNFTFSIFNL